MIMFDAAITKLKKIAIRFQERFGEADLVAYTLISIYLDKVSCDNSSKFDSTNGVNCDLVAPNDNLSKFDTQDNPNDK